MKTDHIKMLCDIAELDNIFVQSSSLEICIEKMVEMVADHIHSDVCSIYLYEENTKNLVLKATQGLNPKFINNLKLKLGEGLVGLSLKLKKPINEKNAKDNPNYKFIPELSEEIYGSFLAVPLLRGKNRIGVLVVQRGNDRNFSKNDLLALRATASQLATMIENIQYLILLESHGVVNKAEIDIDELKFIKGKTSSQGYFYGKAVVFSQTSDLVWENEKAGIGISEFEKAIIKTELELESLQNLVGERLSDAASLIFTAQLMMLKDPGYVNGIKDNIKSGITPCNSVVNIFNKYKKIFLSSPNELIQEKVQDLQDLSQKVIDNIIGLKKEKDVVREKIVITRDLFPSDLLQLSAENVGGIIMVGGGVTSHISILARSLNIPLVFTDNVALLNLPQNEIDVLVDGEIGNIYVNPEDEIVEKFRERNRARIEFEKIDDFSRQLAKTSDGHHVNLMININLLSDLKNVGENEIGGVGLYRTEFPFMIRNSFPSEEEQYAIYNKLVNEMKGKIITFRTLDIGGDKVLPYYSSFKEENPFLGMRSIRFSLSHEDIFKDQLRAILRASVGEDVKIMFPMISSVDELRKCKEILKECVDELEEADVPHNSDPEIGIMVELPSAVTIIDDLAEESDFFSIGTNDLIQYTLAVDRTNEKVSHLYLSHHPAVIKSLKIISDSAQKYGIDVSVCGDMASNEQYLKFFLGIGVRNFSIDTIYIPKIKKVISKIEIEESEDFANKMLSYKTIKEIEEFIA